MRSINNRVVAIDPSLSRSGLVYLPKGAIRPVVTSIPTKGMLGCERLIHIRNTVANALEESQPALLVIEGYSMNSKHGRHYNIGELGGVLRILAYESNIPTLEVPPSNLKMFTTGKGGGKSIDSKKAIRKVVLEEWGVECKNTDESDAYALYMMGLASLGQYTVRKSYRRNSLATCSYM